MSATATLHFNTQFKKYFVIDNSIRSMFLDFRGRTNEKRISKNGTVIPMYEANTSKISSS